MKKGDGTRATILGEALRQISVAGVGGVSIGELASSLKLSKSGLFAHFGSKDRLAVEVLQVAADRFVEQVVRPAIREPRGEPRLRALFERWVAWGTSPKLPGGCVFIQLAAELDAQPGPVRDALVRLQLDWHAALAKAAKISIEAGHFRPDLDPHQFAFEMYALMLCFHHHLRLLDNPSSELWVRRGFDALLERSRSPAAETGGTDSARASLDA